MATKSRTTVRLEEDLLKKAQHRCIDEGITFQKLIERAVEDYLKKPLRKNKKEARK